MTKSRTSNATAVQPATNKLVCCLDCALAQLHKYDNNPILAACEAHPQTGNERFPFEVVVASFLRHCKQHMHTEKVKDIEQRKKAA